VRLGNFAAILLVGGAIACASSSTSRDSPAATAPDPAQIAELQLFFERTFERRLAGSPQFQTALGLKDDYGKWDSITEAKARADLEAVARELAELRSRFDPALLDESSRLSYELFEIKALDEIAGYEWRFHAYPVNQMFGMQAAIPAFLLNFHQITSESDAVAYVSRLRGVKPLIAQLIRNLEVRADRGILPPQFVFPYVLGDSRNVLSGAPFDATADAGTLLSDFETKVAKLDLPAARRESLIDAAVRALIECVGPAYRSLIAAVESLQTLASRDDGAWKLPNGRDYYAFRLRHITTTDLSAQEIHELGLLEVARIHAEMRAVMRAVSFEGTLQDFFAFARTDDRFYHPDTDEGRAAYLARADDLLAGMTEKLPESFVTLPKADLVAKAVEPFREKSAGKAFYSRPAPDGSRPGIFYANLYSMRDMPIYELESLVYHEGVPGHHLQIAVASELADLPRFRRFGGTTAYIEGWGLYAERLGREMGFFEDPYSDFGRLSLELWRACRLVVDTGIHEYRWTRERAIDYLVENTPASEAASRKAIERYIVMPGQATAYKIGMLRILTAREKARSALGDAFELREFHDVVLRNGAVPMPVLEAIVDRWTRAQLF